MFDHGKTGVSELSTELSESLKQVYLRQRVEYLTDISL